MELTTLTVSQLNAYVKTVFDRDTAFASVLVTGEISNFSPHYKSGHLYFSLKDPGGSIKAVMFAREAFRLRFRPENGMRVIAAGRVTVYERDGVYQLYVRELIPDGAGALAVAFEQLKQKLAREGLFDPAHKKKLPPFPHTVGVVTSPKAAALQDILNVLGRRFPLCRVLIAGASVQGANAPAQLIAALSALQRQPGVDVIILARGGGSAEDLWCFNDEALARAVYACPIPVVSAVGHETDTTLADLVSDVRAPTPSAAAELVSPDIDDLRYRAAALSERLHAAAVKALAEKRQGLRLTTAGMDFSKKNAALSAERARLDSLVSRLRAARGIGVSRSAAAFHVLSSRLIPAAQRELRVKREALSGAAAALGALDPDRVLRRGYAIVQKEGGVQERAAGLSPGDALTLRFADGAVRVLVTGLCDTEHNASSGQGE